MGSILKIKRVTAAVAVLSLSFLIPAQVMGAERVAAAQSKTSDLSTSTAKAFMRQWLTMIDTNAPLDDYLKYLPDGDFEQWSYPNAEIKNVEHLKMYFQKTWGMITKNTNKVTELDAVKLDGGRFEIVTNVAWTAITASGKTLAKDLRYTVTIGKGKSTADPAGQHPKIFRYKITPQ